MTRMREPEPEQRHTFVVRADQPLIGIIVADGDEESVRYFTDEAAADAAATPAGVQRALSLLGAWEDLDWEEAEAELDRIRHANPPTAPISL
jgi:hypothetical protein